MSNRIHNAELRREIAERVRICARWLRVNGFEIIAITGGLIQPRIIIKHSSKLCSTLEGVVQAFERTAGNSGRWYSYAVRFNCMIEWDEPMFFSREQIFNAKWKEWKEGAV